MTPIIHLKTGHHKPYHQSNQSSSVAADPLHNNNNNNNNNNAAKTQNCKKPIELLPFSRLRHWLFPSTSSSTSWCEVESGGRGGTAFNHHKHHHQQQSSPYGHPIAAPHSESADGGGGATGIQHQQKKLANGAGGFSVEPVVYIQSKTRRLAFGSSQNLSSAANKSYESGLRDETYVRHLQEFYNNSTFTRIAKIFSAGVLLIAFLMFVSELVRRQEQRLEKEGMVAAGKVASGPFDDDG